MHPWGQQGPSLSTPSLSPAEASLVCAQLGLGQFSGKGLEVSCSGISSVTALYPEFPPLLIRVIGDESHLFSSRSFPFSRLMVEQRWFWDCCRNHIGTIWEPQLYSGLCACSARKAGQPEKRGLLSLDGMGDRQTPEGLDHLKGPWRISYREPCEVGWKEAHNWCSANFRFTKKKKKKCSAFPNPLSPTGALWSGSFLPWLDTIPAIYHHLYF